MGYIKKLKNNELVGGTDKTTIYPVTSTKAVFEEVTNGDKSSFKSQETINKEQQDELDDHEERIQAAEAEDIKSITINGSTKKFEVDDENNVDLTIYTVDSDPEMPDIADKVGDLRDMVGTSTPVLETSHKTRIETLEATVGTGGTVDQRISNAVTIEKNRAEGIEGGLQTQVTALDNGKQVKLSVGAGITLTEDGTISATADPSVGKVVETLPTGDDIIEGMIYLVQTTTAGTYKQWVHDGSTWVDKGNISLGITTDDTLDSTSSNPIQNAAIAAQIGYFVCGNSYASSEIKDVDALGFNLPDVGGDFKIKMNAANTHAGPVYLRFNSSNNTKAELKYNRESVSPTNTWDENEVISVYYDGTYYQASNAQGGGKKDYTYRNEEDYLTCTLGVIPMSGTTWNIATNYMHSHKVMEVNGNEFVKVTANSSKEARISFLKSYVKPDEEHTSIDYCTGYSSPIVVSADSTSTLKIPKDCNYIVANCINNSSQANSDHTPSYIGLSVVGDEWYKDTDYIGGKVIGSYRSDGYGGTSAISSPSIPVKKGKVRITLTGNAEKPGSLGATYYFVQISTAENERVYQCFNTFSATSSAWYVDCNVSVLTRRSFIVEFENDTEITMQHRIAAATHIEMVVEQLEGDLVDDVAKTKLNAEYDLIPVSSSVLDTTTTNAWIQSPVVGLKSGGVYRVVIKGDSLVPHFLNKVSAWASLALHEKGESPSSHTGDFHRIHLFTPDENIYSDGWDSGYFTVEDDDAKYLSLAYKITSGSMTMTVYQAAGNLNKALVDVNNLKVNLDEYAESYKEIPSMKVTSDYLSRHFVALTQGFSIKNDYGRYCRIKNESSTYTEGIIGILGEPTNEFTQEIAFSDTGDTSTRMSIVVVTSEGEHIITNNGSNNSFSYSWIADGVDSKMPYVSEVIVKVHNGELTVSVDGSSPRVMITDSDEVKSVYLKVTTNNSTDIIVSDYVSGGYETALRTHPQVYVSNYPMEVYGNSLYIAYYANDTGKLTVYKRNFLTGVTQESVKDVTVIGDTHEYIAMTIDNDGFMHIMCNCHATPLYYLYGDTSDIDTIGISDKLAWNSATYPAFIKSGDKLYATYRDGASYAGRWKVYEYDYTLQTFSSTTGETWIADGTDNGSGDQTANTACPYLERWVENDGWYYNSFCWRNTGDTSSNHDICLIKTQDFQTFYNYMDDELILPITLDNRNKCMVKMISTGKHLLNQHGIRTIIVNDEPVVMYLTDDEDGNTNLFLMSFDGNKKTERRLTNFIGTTYNNHLYVSYDAVPGFVVVSLNYWLKSFFVEKDLTVYESECIFEDLVPKNGTKPNIEKSGRSLYQAYLGYPKGVLANGFNNRYDKDYTYGIQIIR